MWTVLWKNQWRNVCRFHTSAFLKAFEKSNSPKDKVSLQDSDSLQKNGKPNNGMYKVGVKNSVYQRKVLIWTPFKICLLCKNKITWRTSQQKHNFWKLQENSARVKKKKNLLSLSVKYINKQLSQWIID